MSAKDTSASPTESVVTVRIAVTTEESREQQETDELLNGIGADPLYIRALPVYLAARGKTAERLRGVS